MLTVDVDVLPRAGEPHADLPPGVEPADDWAERVRAAHAEGYAVVAGAIDVAERRTDGAPASSSRTGPGPRPQAGIRRSAVCPSVLDGVGSNGSPTSPACPPTPHRSKSRGSTTGASSYGCGARS